MVNISYHPNSLSCLVPPITTSLSGLISSSHFLLLSLTNENPPRVGSESSQFAPYRQQPGLRASHNLQGAGTRWQIWSGLGRRSTTPFEDILRFSIIQSATLQP